MPTGRMDLLLVFGGRLSRVLCGTFTLAVFSGFSLCCALRLMSQMEDFILPLLLPIHTKYPATLGAEGSAYEWQQKTHTKKTDGSPDGALMPRILAREAVVPNSPEGQEWC